MRLAYDAPVLDTLEDRCQLLELFAECCVQAQALEMRDNKDDFPCCVKCGEMSFGAIPGMPGSPGPPSDGPPISDDQSEALRSADGVEDEVAHRDAHGGPGALRVQSARELSRSRRGHALELAVFQAAAERVRDHDCKVIVDHDATGQCHAYVAFPDGKIVNPQDEAVSTEACGCGGDHG